MVKSLRLRKMEEYILEKGVASMDELCKQYEISMNTLRNDIAELTEKGTIKKVYGGVCSNITVSGNAIVSYDERKTQNVQCKREIAAAAAEYVQDGDIIYIDSGTTAASMVDYLENKSKLTIITHSLDVINKACHLSGVEVFCLGGKFQNSTNCFIGATALGMMEHYNIGKAFMATKGITADGAITDSSMGEYDIKQWAVKKSNEVFLMADSRKYGRAGLISYTNLEKIDTLITDSMVEEPLLELCRKTSTKVRTV